MALTLQEFMKKPNWPTFKQDMIEHYSRYWLHWLVGFFAIVTFQHFFLFGINVTESLPYNVFLVDKHPTHIKNGDLVSFRWAGGGGYPAGITFLKIVSGLPGDQVTVDAERNFYINCSWVGLAKKLSRKGEKLEIGRTGKIPPGYMYVKAPHVDSLDSRYAITGWVPMTSIEGRAIFAY